ncbi:DUF4440 domain-containing protein [Sphingomonas antarctica]|uniref:nuclear transport factor 2 family protein n=1 Tax=Sphingomonas antarctica TaxID=2040274 RepID=UPI0039E767BF
MILISIALAVTPIAPIVKGTALPPPETAEGAVMAPITTLLDALTHKDGAAMLAVTLPEGSITAARVEADGSHSHKTLRWADFAAVIKPGGPRIVETLGTPAIEIDEDVAMVWAPYTVTADGTLSHCGYDHFDLVRSGGAWKILNITYSHRTTGCAPQ